MEKDCKLVFSNGQPDYEFAARDLDRALAWAKEKNIPLQAIRTPWYVLSPLDEDTYNTAMEVFSDK